MAAARRDRHAALGRLVTTGLAFLGIWHALDIIWVAIFTIVYLIGTLP